MSTVRFTILCHAATTAARRAIFPRDEPLDLRGRKSAIAARANFRRFDGVLTSPALRARQTADALGFEGEINPSLRDLDYGRWAGMPIAEVAGCEPAELSAWRTNPLAAPHGGESIATLFARTRVFLEGRLTQPGVFLAVSHPAILRAAAVLALDAPFPAFWQIDAGPLSALTLTSDGSTWRLRSLSNAREPRPRRATFSPTIREP